MINNSAAYDNDHRGSLKPLVRRGDDNGYFKKHLFMNIIGEALGKKLRDVESDKYYFNRHHVR